jgi:hypothetical protein
MFRRHRRQLEPEVGEKGEAKSLRRHNPTPDVDRPWNQPTLVQVGVDGYGNAFGCVDSGICSMRKP